MVPAQPEKSILDYLKIGEKIPFQEIWHKLMIEWGAVLNDYMRLGQDMNAWVRQRGGDLPYWHAKEETNLGFLAAAVWRLGGVCLQEYEVTRPQNGGAADLWFKVQTLSCQVEAKGTNLASTERDPIEQVLLQARNQLIIPQEEKASMGLALCFVAPAITGSTYDFRQLIRQFDGDLYMAAVYLPSRAMTYQGYGYPGVALIGQVVWLPSSEAVTSEAAQIVPPHSS